VPLCVVSLLSHIDIETLSFSTVVCVVPLLAHIDIETLSFSTVVCCAVGISDAVTIPGAATLNDRLDDTTIEIGLGIHGEVRRQDGTRQD
jgi:hypothetical protein